MSLAEVTWGLGSGTTEVVHKDSSDELRLHAGHLTWDLVQEE